MVAITINGKEVSGLLDSGATCSCMTTDMAEEIFGTDWPKLAKHCTTQLAGADSRSLDVKGEIVVDIEIGSKKFKHKIVVYKPATKRSVLLLGNDLFIDNFANVGGRFLCSLKPDGQLDNQQIPIIYNSRTKDVIVKNNQVIPAHTRSVIRGQVAKDDSIEWVGQNVIFDPELKEVNCLLSVPDTITKVLPGQEVAIPIDNDTDFDIALDSGQSLGHVNIAISEDECNIHFVGNDNFEIIKESFPSEQTILHIQDYVNEVRKSDKLYRHHAELHDAEGEQSILNGSPDGSIPPPPGIEMSDEVDYNLEDELKLDHLPAFHRKQLFDLLLNKHRAVFSKNDIDIGTTHILKHKIDVGDNKPIAVPYRPVPHHYRDEVDKLLKQLLKIGVIGYSKGSPWASNMVIVRKKDTNKIRVCVDYRAVNSITQNGSKWPHSEHRS